MSNIVSVVVNRLTRSVDKLFDYTAPDELYSKLKIGSMVYVPFGKGDNVIEGFVVGFPETSTVDSLKEIVAISSDEPLFDEELFAVAKFMKEKYFSTLISAIKTILPPGVGVHFDKTNEMFVKGVELNISYDDAYSYLELLRDKAPMQTRVLELMIQNDFVSYSDVCMITGCSRTVIKTLVSKSILIESEVSVYRNPIDYDAIEQTYSFEPNDEQKTAINMISDEENFGTFLLYGVTGSGKTEVFLQCIEKKIKDNKTAIVLVPEISLTPQIIERFVSRFGKKVAVLHSKLSAGERSDEYRRIKNGEVSVVIGVRSAIFAPIKNLGIIIIDEEHENTYKSENLPAYHAREVAQFRAQYNDIPLVLSSATPDITTFYKAQTGEYKLISLTKRVNQKNLPNVELVDMRQELINGNRSIISDRLREEIEKNLKNKQQTILFLNRRGFSSFVSCRSCGYTAKCQRCNISLTYHKSNESLTCHYCGYTIKNLKICPKCLSPYIRHFGVGTQKVDDDIKNSFPGSTTAPMGVDTTTKKSSHSDILNRFKEEKTDILIGTQMVTKGLDFPSVTLVGVLAADMGLNINDYRSGERTFDLITQVCGRAGRGEVAGRALVQTYAPENDIILHAKEQNYIAFYENEINLRQILRYPPFCDIISILFTASTNNSVSSYAQKVRNYIERAFLLNNIIDSSDVLGPTPSNLSRINNKYRWRILIKCNMNDKIKTIINNLIKGHNKTKESKWITMHIEYNPNNIV